MYGRKAWTVVAYTYDADWHCPDCAEKRFGIALHEDGDAEAPLWDSEGNPVRAVFLSDYEGAEDTEKCGDCGTDID